MVSDSNLVCVESSAVHRRSGGNTRGPIAHRFRNSCSTLSGTRSMAMSPLSPLQLASGLVSSLDGSLANRSRVRVSRLGLAALENAQSLVAVESRTPVDELRENIVHVISRWIRIRFAIHCFVSASLPSSLSSSFSSLACRWGIVSSRFRQIISSHLDGWTVTVQFSPKVKSLRLGLAFG